MRRGRPGVGPLPCRPPRPCAPPHCATCGRTSRTRWSGPPRWARAALDAGLLDLPLPGRGATADRFAALADLGGTDLDLARLAEAHVDAAAIRADLGGRRPGRRSVGGLGREPAGRPAARPPVGRRLAAGRHQALVQRRRVLRPCAGHGPHRRRVSAVRGRPGRPSRGRRRRHLAGGRDAGQRQPVGAVRRGARRTGRRPAGVPGAAGLLARGGRRGSRVVGRGARDRARAGAGRRPPAAGPARAGPRRRGRRRPGWRRVPCSTAAARSFDADPEDAAGDGPADRRPGPRGGRAERRRGGRADRPGARRGAARPRRRPRPPGRGPRCSTCARATPSPTSRSSAAPAWTPAGRPGWTGRPGRDGDRAVGRHRRDGCGATGRRRPAGPSWTCAALADRRRSSCWPRTPTTRCSGSAGCWPGWPASAPTCAWSGPPTARPPTPAPTAPVGRPARAPSAGRSRR